jgi:hypothetical protein
VDTSYHHAASESPTFGHSHDPEKAALGGGIRDARRADCHSSAGGGIEHPCRHRDYNARRHLDVNDIATCAPFNTLASNAAPIECMPAIMDLDLLPDMRRMTGRLRSAARPGCSPAPTLAAGAPRRCSR